MEKAILDFFFSAFIIFHREIGLLVILFLVFWLMSGRRPSPWTYTGVFAKTLALVAKKSLKTCEAAAKSTASFVPTKHAKWRPVVKVVAQTGYVILTIGAIGLLVSQCAQR